MDADYWCDECDVHCRLTVSDHFTAPRACPLDAREITWQGVADFQRARLAPRVDAGKLRRFDALPKMCATCKNWGEDHACKRESYPWNEDTIPNHWFGKRMASVAVVSTGMHCWEPLEDDD